MRRDEFVAALMLLTRLPVGRLARTAPPPGQAVWAYPVVGAMVGLAGAGVFWAAAAAGLPPTLSALFAVATTMLLTGGLHEDGLADTADGFGGGRDRARKLAIMRDSRIGSYGALALMLSLAVRVAALAAMRHPAVAMIVSGALGRGAMVGLLLMLRPARRDGLAASLGKPPRGAARGGARSRGADRQRRPGGVARGRPRGAGDGDARPAADRRLHGRRAGGDRTGGRVRGAHRPAGSMTSTAPSAGAAASKSTACPRASAPSTFSGPPWVMIAWSPGPRAR